MAYPSNWDVSVGGGLPKGSTYRSMRVFKDGDAPPKWEDMAFSWADLSGAMVLTVSSGAAPQNRMMQISNDGSPGDAALEFTFDGVTLHGKVLAGETRSYGERFEAGIAVRHGGDHAIGGITVVDGGVLVDGDNFILDDGANPAVTFEFDRDASVVETATLRQIVFAGTETLSEVRDLIIDAVNTAPTLDITASIKDADELDLVNDRPGVAGNVALVENVTDGGFTVTGMSGGTGSPVPFRVEAW